MTSCDVTAPSGDQREGGSRNTQNPKPGCGSRVAQCTQLYLGSKAGRSEIMGFAVGGPFQHPQTHSEASVNIISCFFLLSFSLSMFTNFSDFWPLRFSLCRILCFFLYITHAVCVTIFFLFFTVLYFSIEFVLFCF